MKASKFSEAQIAFVLKHAVVQNLQIKDEVGMRIARHPSERRILSVNDYELEFGRPAIGSPASEPQRARCLFCAQHLWVRAATPQRVAHFAHGPNSGFCASKEPIGRPFLELQPTEPDRPAAQHARRAFRRRWKWHWEKLRELIPYMSCQEFLELLRAATDRNVWAHKDLPVELVPYVLVLSRDYPPHTGIKRDGAPLRELWFRFLLDHQVDGLERLWIDPPPAPKLYRCSFIAPATRRGRPVLRDLAAVKELPMSGEFLDRPEPTIREWVEAKVQEWFSRHPLFRGEP